jgi:hypothetical protein
MRLNKNDEPACIKTNFLFPQQESAGEREHEAKIFTTGASL